MKPRKLEFVVFGISQKTAQSLWEIITRFIEFSGFSITGDVTEIDEVDWSDPSVYYSNEDEHDD